MPGPHAGQAASNSCGVAIGVAFYWLEGNCAGCGAGWLREKLVTSPTLPGLIRTLRRSGVHDIRSGLLGISSSRTPLPCWGWLSLRAKPCERDPIHGWALQSRPMRFYLAWVSWVSTRLLPPNGCPERSDRYTRQAVLSAPVGPPKPMSDDKRNKIADAAIHTRACDMQEVEGTHRRKARGRKARGGRPSRMPRASNSSCCTRRHYPKHTINS